MSDYVIFSEKQRFIDSVMMKVVLLVILGIDLAVLFIIKKTMPQDQQLMVLLPVLAVMVILVVLAYLFSLKVKVLTDGIHYHFGIGEGSFKTITWDEIKSCEKRTYSAIPEYGGWGIRFGPSGKALNVSGNEGVQLILNNDKKLLIGSQKSDELLHAINEAKKT